MHEHAHGLVPGLLVGDQGLADVGLELARDFAEHRAYARVLTVVIAQGGSDAVEVLVYPGRGGIQRVAGLLAVEPVPAEVGGGQWTMGVLAKDGQDIGPRLGAGPAAPQPGIGRLAV